ncbi:hypothetical protein [Actinophytocola sp. NPDC049390]|uniref:hypothetical protein n=1 Tax=Actinophytocola sp. NPDC049390 TaxID=3363894 RepID=UPI00379B3D92
MTDLPNPVRAERRDVLRLASTRAVSDRAATEFPGCVPVHRAIVGIDVVNSSVRVNPAKGLLRHRMHGILEEALSASGITDQKRDAVVDRGDGALVLVRPLDEVPKTVLLAEVVPALEHLLAEHNTRDPRHGFQLRVAVHAGEVHHDRWGPFGESLDLTCRLLDAPVLKATLADVDVPLALVVSDDFYRSVVRHGYDDVDSTPFTPLVRVEVAGASHAGWIRDVRPASPAGW